MNHLLSPDDPFSFLSPCDRIRGRAGMSHFLVAENRENATRREGGSMRVQGRTRRRDERDDDPRRVDDVDGRNRRARDGERDPRSSEEGETSPNPRGGSNDLSKRVPRFVAARLRRIPQNPRFPGGGRVSIFARIEERSNERRDFLVPVLFRHLVSSLLSRVCGGATARAGAPDSAATHVIGIVPGSFVRLYAAAA